MNSKYFMILCIFVAVFNGCGKEIVEDFVPVTDITGVSAVAEAGKPLSLAATVSPPDATNQTIVWSVKDAGVTGATITGGNVFTASAAGTATVTATIANGATKTAPYTADFTISVMNAEEMPVVTNVTVSPATVSVAKGKTQTFTATVTGSKLEEAHKTVNWTVTGGAKTGTVITADGELTIAEDETTASLTVKATSTVDNSKSGTATVTVTDETAIQGNTLAEKLQWLKSHAASGTVYSIEVNANENLDPHELAYSGKDNITIQLKGTGSERVIGLTGNGSLFTIREGVTLILDNNITLKGLYDSPGNNNRALVTISGGSLVINEGAKITGNCCALPNTTTVMGGGINMDGGSLTMNGGEISDNQALNSNTATTHAAGGGVCVTNGTFTMNGGVIKENRCMSTSENTLALAYGGGVYIIEGVFNLNGGTITGNQARAQALRNSSAVSAASHGGGVYVTNSLFDMSGGEISENQANAVSFGSRYSYGSGIYISATPSTMSDGKIMDNTIAINNMESTIHGIGVYVSGSTFTMSGGEISNNIDRNTTLQANGGGVYVDGTFIMEKGVISGNTGYSGGGIYIAENRSCTMNDGTISGNTALHSGGGVYVDNHGTFTLNKGKISGNTATGSAYGTNGQGGGVKSWGYFYMEGGEIFANKAINYGGGVDVQVDIRVGVGAFAKNGGIIYGYTAGDANSNIVTYGTTIYNNRGSAVSVYCPGTTAIRALKETTAGTNDHLLFDGETTPPTFTGAWDSKVELQ